jgi:hypothetical protein
MATRLRALEAENAKLKRLLADHLAEEGKALWLVANPADRASRR